MQYRIKTPVTAEPLTLSEVKTHLRLTSETFSEDTTTYQTIYPGSHEVVASYGLVGNSVDVSGKQCIVNLTSGTCGTGGSITAKIQESDDDISWQDYTDGAFTVVTESNDNAIQEIEYSGTKQYIRVVATVAVAACGFGVNVLVRTGDAVEDDFLTALIVAAREYCEQFTSRALAEQTIVAYLDHFPPCNNFELPRPPLQSVTSLKYINSSNETTTMVQDTDYMVDTDSLLGRIALPYGETWPQFTAWPVNPVQIEYVAGYDESNPIPTTIKQAMLMLIGHWYSNREASVIGSITSVSVEFSVKTLLSNWKVRWF